MTPALLAALEALIPAQRRLYQEPMARHTTFRIGGPADLLIDVADAGELARLLRLCREAGEPTLVIGNGSNLLVSDQGIRGVVLRIGPAMDARRVEGDALIIGAGTQLRALSRAAAEASLSGFAFAEGIPGTVGGGVAMNAGAYGGELCQVVRSVTAVDGEGRLRELEAEQLGFSYRDSALLREGLYATEIRLAGTPGEQAEIRAEMEDYSRRRREKQPLEWPSAGSTFKRPLNGYASALIDAAGLKGCAVGGAQVSEKHAGFLINKGGATASDMLALMRHVRAEVERASGIRLMPEVRLVGEYPPDIWEEWRE